MAKPEWGSKRTCPECSTRFYDLGKGEPVTCISCGHVWTPGPLLKSRQHDARTRKPRAKPDRQVKDTDAEKPDSADAGAEVDTDVDDQVKTDADGKGREKPVPDADEDDNNPDPAAGTVQKIDAKKG
ncbi:MAG: TIGR02300 family protein [Proteobacteria bacterium]|nr:TIGR02300 family protein [Pseudomonadota bacterium]